MKLFYPLFCVALTLLVSTSSLRANTFFAQVTHSEKVPQMCETSTWLDYLEWSSMEELYKQATTLPPTQAPLVANKNGTPPPQKLLEVPLSLFTFPKVPETRFWFWMSKADTVKKEKIQHFIEETKELSSPKPAEKLFEMIVQHGVRKKHKSTLQKVRTLLNTSKSTTAVPFVENLVKQLDEAEFDHIIEKMKTSSQRLESDEKSMFWENIGKISDPSKQLTLLEHAPQSLLSDKACVPFFQTVTAKPLLEKTVDQILKNTEFLRVLPDELLKKILQQKEKYARENFWLQQISALATGNPHLFDTEALNAKEAAFLGDIHMNHERIFFIKSRLNKLGEEKFLNIISQNDEEKKTVSATSDKITPLEKK